jgi:predicted dehydrogenase
VPSLHRETAFPQTDKSFHEEHAGRRTQPIELPVASQSVASNVIDAVTNGSPLGCPADHALDTVQLLEAIARSSATRQLIRL